MIKPRFEIGDLVVDKLSKYKTDKFYICRITDIEEMEACEFLYDYDNDSIDVESVSPTLLYMTEVVYVKQDNGYRVELEDVIFYEEFEIMTLEEYLAEEPLTIQEYVSWKQKH
jgi:hypothetical protein